MPNEPLAGKHRTCTKISLVLRFRLNVLRHARVENLSYATASKSSLKYELLLYTNTQEKAVVPLSYNGRNLFEPIYNGRIFELQRSYL